MAYTNNGDVELYYERHGETGPGLVFAHGAGGNATSWFQQVPEFSGDFSVVVFDHRGFARSPCPVEQQSALHFEADLFAVMDAAGLDDATIVCQSMAAGPELARLLRNRSASGRCCLPIRPAPFAIRR